ncbi:WASH complex subunit 2C-like isoform X4 [Biomphalaria glabrata]|uniref:WASH complex subunit 2C-like isoform X4 n=1 Tax=Biomphalaria glabrata TaxID=6526 RepID=A0A9W2ZA20_BIOGL|nr:WASH complex subunit 2C-like isoform X4 [Biomphalaria glabrata]
MAASAPPTGLSSEESGILSPMMATTTTEVAHNGPRVWERAWTTQEMRKEAGNWSLAADAGLLQYLQQFSQHIISRTHEIGKDVDDLVHEAKLTGVRVNNVINDFIMLANTQFVENRVFDEDVSQDTSKEEEKKTEKQEKSREQREAELIPRVSNALKLGIDVIDCAFEKLDTKVVDSDSEEEENNGHADPILEAKDPYANRLLPYLIGTPQFMEDDNVGLTDDMSDEGEEEEVSESESEPSLSSSIESDDEEEIKATPKTKQVHSSSSSEESDSESDEELFGQKTEKDNDVSTSESEEENETETIEKSVLPKGPGDFASELAAKIGVNKTHKKDVDAVADDWGENSEQTSNTQSKEKNKPTDDKKHKHEKEKRNASKHNEDDLFGASEGPEDDFLFGKSSGLFSSSKGLFDDDDDKDDEGGLFADVPKSSSKPKKQTSKEKPTSVFDEEEEDEVKEEEQTVVPDSRPRTKSGKVLPKGAVSVFGIPKEPSKTEVSNTHVVKKPTPQPAVAAAPKKSGGLFDDEEEDDDLFNAVATKKTEPDKKEKSSTAKAAPANKKVDLFADDEEEEDLFSTMAAPGRKKTHSTVGLTVEGNEEEQAIKAKKQQEAEQLRKQSTPEKKLPAGAVSMFGKEPNPLLAALKKNKQPDSDEENEAEEDKMSRSSSIHSNNSASVAVSKPAEETVKKSARAGSLFDDDEDDDLFTKKPSTGRDKKNNEPVTKSDKSKAVKDSLFNEADDSDEDFFSTQAKPAENKKPTGGVSLFGGVDVLGVKDKQDSKPTAAVAPPTAATKTVAPVTASVTKKSGSSLFDEDEEDDDFLFSSKPNKSSGDKQNSKKASQNLFEDDDLLFKAGEETSPTVDLFSNKGPLAKPTPKEKEPEKKAAPAKSNAKSTVSDLFGGESEEDDLFSSSSVKTSQATTAVKPTVQTTSGLTESSDTMEVKQQEEEVKKPKKPAGAVSMFGGMDPSALLKKRKPSDAEEDKAPAKEEAKEESRDKRKSEEKVIPEEKKETASTKEPDTSMKDSKPKPPVDLFAGDDEEEDLFAPKPRAGNKKIEGVTTTESNDSPTKEEPPVASPTKSRKPAGAVSMFGGGIDPLAILKKSKKPSEEDAAKEDEPKEKVIPPEVAPKTRTKSDADKLTPAEVAVKTKPSPEVAAKTKPSPADKEDEDLKPKPPVDLFGGEDEDEDDLFGAPKKKSTPPPTAPKSAPMESPKEESEAKSPEPAKFKKPAGAVSMFGGLDPFAGMKKKSIDEKEEAKEPSPPSEEPKSPTINPAVLLPGASHPSLGKALERSESVDFDQPAEAEVLASASKDRPKLNRRRPQSRKARMIAAGSSGISFEDTTPTTPTTPTIPEVPSLSDQLVSESPKKAGSPAENHVASKEGSPKSASRDLFGNDDLIEGPSLPSLKGAVKESSQQDDIFSKDSFSAKNAKDKTTADDLFSTSTTDKFKAGDSLQKSVTAKAGNTSSKKIADDDDLFKAPVKSKSINVSKVLDDDDDLFSSSSIKKKEQTKPDPLLGDAVASSKLESKSGISNDIVDKSSSKKTKPVEVEEDIFADSSLGKKKDSKPKKATYDDDDDLFASKALEDTKKAKPKKAMTSDTKLLNDTTDIFSDIPVVTSKETKKKVTKKATEKKTIFKDDVDDIFADTPVVTPKGKKEVKKKATGGKNANVDADNIFDDPMS